MPSLHFDRPESRFATTPAGRVGYQVFGEGPDDLVFLTHWITNIDAIWDEPSAARYLSRLATFGRVIMIDKRGSGISDGPQRGWVDPVADARQDVVAVLDDLGVETATLIGDTEGGTLAIILAAYDPERFPGLVLVNSYARFRRSDDYPIGAPDEVIETLERNWREMYGVNADTLVVTAPSVANDPRFRSWYPRFQRLSMAPAIAAQAVHWIGETDVRAFVPLVEAETLVICRKDALFHRPIHSGYLARNIRNARLVELEGADTIPWHAGNFTPVLDEIEAFVKGGHRSVQTNRTLSTVMFTDIVGSTALAAEIGDERWLDLRADHDRLTRQAIERHGGEEVAATGDGWLATFDSPQAAVLCALSIRSAVLPLGIDIRAGIHTGEIEKRNGEIGGVGVNLASRVMDMASEGGVMVSGTVKDLVIGSPLEFVECGSFDLKGLPGKWNLFEATHGSLQV